MNNTARLIIGLVIAGALAALATPELAAKLPTGVTTILAAALAEVLRRMNAQKLEDSQCACENCSSPPASPAA